MFRISAACLLALASGAWAQLVLEGVRCGQLRCALTDYCSPTTDRCEPCADICNKTHHNYDSGLCVSKCQDYIHDLRYSGRPGSNGNPADIKSVQLQARAALIISSVALAVFVLLLLIKCVSLFRSHKGKLSLSYIRQKLQPTKNRVNQYPGDLTHHNPHADMPKAPKRDLKLEILRETEPKRQAPNPLPLNPRDLEKRNSQTDKSQGASTPKTMSTCISNRHPAEDTTLDYSYDNMGMNVTPPPASHNF